MTCYKRMKGEVRLREQVEGETACDIAKRRNDKKKRNMKRKACEENCERELRGM